MAIFLGFVVFFLVAYLIVLKGENGLLQDKIVKLSSEDEKSNSKTQETIQRLQNRVAYLEKDALEQIKSREEQVDQKMQQANLALDRVRLEKQEVEQKTKQNQKIVESALSENKVYQEGIEEVVNLWVNDSWKSIADKITPENYGQQKDRLQKLFDTCRKYGIDFDGRQERAFFVRLETVWKAECESAKAKEEQARIREIMKEEQRAEKARASELKKLAEERKEQEKLHEAALDRIKLLKEMESLKKITEDQQKELNEALLANDKLEQEMAENERRKSMAELTKAGHVYVISNMGSFGKDIFKVGMTRRLIPEERVKELGDASVPFPFDVHMMVATEDAPALEFKLHEELWKHRMNLVNDGKEFFSVELATIKKFVDKHGGGVVYEFKDAFPAAQWRESELLRKSGSLDDLRPNRVKKFEDDEAA